MNETIKPIPFFNPRISQKIHFKDFRSSLETRGWTSQTEHVHLNTLGLIRTMDYLETTCGKELAQLRTDEGIMLIKKQGVEIASTQKCLGTFIQHKGPGKSQEDVYSFSQLSHSERMYQHKRFDGESSHVAM